MKQWMKSAMLCTAVVFSQPLWAGDAALYGAMAPADSGFFRIMNASDSSLTVEFKGKSFSLGSGECSSYAFTAPGDYTLSLNGNNLPLKLKTGQQQTVVWDASGSKLLDEQAFKNKAKARVALYNLTKSSLSLLTNKGAPVIGPVTSGAFSAREVNTVQVTLSVGDGQKTLLSTGSMLLKRGTSTSLFVTSIAGQPHLTTVEAAR